MAEKTNPIIVAYLDGELLSDEEQRKRRATHVWFGTNIMRNTSAHVKSLCAASEDGTKCTMWDNDRKLWGTTNFANVPKLIDSGLWEPNGVPPSLKHEVSSEAKRMLGSKKRKQPESADNKQQPVREWTLIRTCLTCGSTPWEQFMECACIDPTSRTWEKCNGCDTIWNPKKLKCKEIEYKRVCAKLKDSPHEEERLSKVKFAILEMIPKIRCRCPADVPTP